MGLQHIVEANSDLSLNCVTPDRGQLKETSPQQR